MSKFFINRPIVAMVISIITVIVGLVTLFTLPIAQFPKIIPPEIFVEAHYVGADARTIEQSVATPIEQQLSGVDNMNYMYSLNANNGLMRLYVNFDVKTDPNVDHMLSQLRSGAIEFFTLSGLILSTLVPVASINGLGFIWESYDKVWPAMDGGLGAHIRAQIAKPACTPSIGSGTTATGR